MNDEQRPDWQVRLARMRARHPDPVVSMNGFSGDLSSEALMTIVAIMKDKSDPKLQMAAAKMVLEKSARMPMTRVNNAAACEPLPPTADDVDAAIALAKVVLDELAGRKTQKLDGAGAMVADGASRTDHSAG